MTEQLRRRFCLWVLRGQTLAEIGNRFRKTFLEIDLRFPAENIPGLRDLGLPHLRIILGKRLVNNRALRIRKRNNPVSEFQDRHFMRVADVYRQMMLDLEQLLYAGDEVVDVLKAPR